LIGQIAIIRHQKFAVEWIDLQCSLELLLSPPHSPESANANGDPIRYRQRAQADQHVTFGVAGIDLGEKLKFRRQRDT
jgi:hypothetical protein